LIAKRFIDCREIDQLQRDFRNENGKMDVAHEASDSGVKLPTAAGT